MKRIIAALAFSTLAVPALADSRPFEQTELDRALPEVSAESASTGSTTSAPRNLPFEQAELDRRQPNVQERDVAESAGQDQRAVSGFEQYNSI